MCAHRVGQKSPLQSFSEEEIFCGISPVADGMLSIGCSSFAVSGGCLSLSFCQGYIHVVADLAHDAVFDNDVVDHVGKAALGTHDLHQARGADGHK